MSERKPTPDQRAIIDYEGNRVVTANPGSGKTFTLARIIKKILPEHPHYKGVIAISYTNKASSELKERCLSDGLEKKKSFFKTIDSFFISEIVMPFVPHLWGESDNVEIKSIRDDFDILIEGEIEEEFSALQDLVKNKKRIPIRDFQNLLTYLYSEGIILLETVGALGNYVFDNSISCRHYLKARYSHVIVDEYQDSGREQHDMFLKLKNLGLCSIAVGDLNQAIYGFAGKGPEYLASLLEDQDFKAFSLSKNMRCHQSISNYSLQLMSANANIEECNDLRVFYRHINGPEVNIAAWIDDRLPHIKNQFGIRNNNQVAILIRNDRSGIIYDDALVTPHKYLKTTSLESDSSPWSTIFRDILYFIFLSHETKSNIVFEHIGDITKPNLRKISSILDELAKLENMPKELINNIEKFEQIARLILANEENANSLKLLEDVLSNQDQLSAFIPPGDDEIQILTLHKSKGLEFNIVLHVDMYDWIIPGGEAAKGNEYALRQDLNLHYVGITRAIDACILISSNQRTLYSGNIGRGTPSRFLDRQNLRNLRNNG